MLARKTLWWLLVLTIAADLTIARPLRRRHLQHRHRQQRTHFHQHEDDDGEEEVIEEDRHDNLQLIRDIVAMVGFNLTFGRDGLKMYLGSRPINPFPHTESKDLKFRSSESDDEFKNLLKITGLSAKDSVLMIAGRPFLLIPISHDNGVIPTPPEKKQFSSDQRKVHAYNSTAEFLGHLVRSSTPESEFVFPTLLTPNPVTEPFSDLENT